MSNFNIQYKHFLFKKPHYFITIVRYRYTISGAVMAVSGVFKQLKKFWRKRYFFLLQLQTEAKNWNNWIKGSQECIHHVCNCGRYGKLSAALPFTSCFNSIKTWLFSSSVNIFWACVWHADSPYFLVALPLNRSWDVQPSKVEL